MAPTACSLCGSTKDPTMTTIDNRTMEIFTKVTNLTLSTTTTWPMKSCSNCKKNVEIIIRFVGKLQRHQNRLEDNKSKAVCPLSKMQDSLKGLMTSKAVKVGQVTVKKICLEKAEDPLGVPLKSEADEKPSVIYFQNEPESSIEAPKENDFSVIEYEDEDDDDDGDYTESAESESSNSESDDVLLKALKKASAQRALTTALNNSKKAKLLKTLKPGTFEHLSFTCAKCKISFSNFQTLTDHITSRVCEGSSSFKCNICQKGFKNKKNLTSHSFSHRRKKPEKVIGVDTFIKFNKGLSFRCNKCDDSIKSHLELVEHMKTKHPPSGKPKQSSSAGTSKTAT